jgi:hypothetical protein
MRPRNRKAINSDSNPLDSVLLDSQNDANFSAIKRGNNSSSSNKNSSNQQDSDRGECNRPNLIQPIPEEEEVEIGSPFKESSTLSQQQSNRNIVVN